MKNLHLNIALFADCRVMKQLFLCLVLAAQFANSQQVRKTESYQYGYNGMELIAKSHKGTVIISTFNSKTQIRAEIARKIYAMFLDHRIKSNTSVIIKGDDANVIGKCVIMKRDTLTTVNFYYEKVCWYSGLTEIYRKSLS